MAKLAVANQRKGLPEPEADVGDAIPNVLQANAASELQSDLPIDWAAV
jgi:hypothetical protein